MTAPTRSLVTALAIALSLLAALAGGPLTPAVSAEGRTFAVHLSSAGTGCPSLAQGQALFRVDDEGRFTWRIIVADIDNVTGAQLAAPSLDDAVRLFGGRGTPPGGIDPGNGLFAGGTLEADPGYITALVAALEDATATVTVYTADCPGGELRGPAR